MARYRDGTFGWGVEQPGHGLVFVNASRPLDAPAAAPLSASGDYAPLLLLERADEPIPTSAARDTAEISSPPMAIPQYAPVRGVYNHGWLIGGEEAITARSVQAELDAMLEIAPRRPQQLRHLLRAPNTEPDPPEPTTSTPATPT